MDLEMDQLDPREPIITPDVQIRNLQRLAAQVINQAVRELSAKQQPVAKRMRAFLWLTGPSFAIWADWAGMDYANPYKYLLPNLRKIRKKLMRKDE